MWMKTLGADVLAAVEKIVMTEGARDEAIAREYVKRLRQKERYSENVWSWAPHHNHMRVRSSFTAWFIDSFVIICLYSF